MAAFCAIIINGSAIFTVDKIVHDDIFYLYIKTEGTYIWGNLRKQERRQKWLMNYHCKTLTQKIFIL